MKKIWQEFKSFIKMISKGKKDVAVVMAAGGFMKASIPFLVFYFSAQILNNAIEGDYKACVKSVATLLLSQFVCELVNRFCQKRIEVLGESCQQIIRQQMADKAFELQYEKFEKQETLDSLRRAKLTAGGNGDIKDQVDTCYQIFVQFFFHVLFGRIFSSAVAENRCRTEKNIFCLLWINAAFDWLICSCCNCEFISWKNTQRETV